MQQEFIEELMSFGIMFSTLSSVLLASARPESLTPMQFEILQIVHSAGKSTLSELCGCTKLSMPNASREVRKLVEKGLIKKVDDDKDKRVNWLVLSDEGNRMIDEAYRVLEGIFMERYKDCTNDEIGRMAECLRYLKSRL